MKAFIYKNASFFYLGFALGVFTDLKVYSWKFWAIIIPIATIDLIKEIREAK